MNDAAAMAARLFALARALHDIGEKACESMALEAQKNAQALVPVQTGRLRASIRADEGTLSAACEYAPYVELGTARMSAHPFLTPAAHAVDRRKHAENALREEI